MNQTNEENFINQRKISILLYSPSALASNLWTIAPACAHFASERAVLQSKSLDPSTSKVHKPHEPWSRPFKPCTLAASYTRLISDLPCVSSPWVGVSRSHIRMRTCGGHRFVHFQGIQFSPSSAVRPSASRFIACSLLRLDPLFSDKLAVPNRDFFTKWT